MDEIFQDIAHLFFKSSEVNFRRNLAKNRVVFHDGDTNVLV